MIAAGSSGLLIVLALAMAASAQDRNPFVNDPKAAEAGKSHFRINIARCAMDWAHVAEGEIPI
jgi:hypothetical protein